VVSVMDRCGRILGFLNRWCETYYYLSNLIMSVHIQHKNSGIKVNFSALHSVLIKGLLYVKLLIYRNANTSLFIYKNSR
jgi:hypothetical protein